MLSFVFCHLAVKGSRGKGNAHHNFVVIRTIQQEKQQQQQQRDVWLRVAIIVVPVIGAFLLVILVIMAVRMLRIDQRRRYQHFQDGHHHHHHHHLHNHIHSCRNNLIYDSAPLTAQSLSAPHLRSLLVTHFLNDKVPLTTATMLPNINNWAQPFTDDYGGVCNDKYPYVKTDSGGDLNAVNVKADGIESSAVSVQTDIVNLCNNDLRTIEK